MLDWLLNLLDITNDITFSVVVFTAIIGLIFGSFATCVGFRLFNDEVSITGKRSVCCKCKHKLGFFDLIPFFSFLFLRGRCRYCREKIPLWHFVAEVFMPITFVIAVVLFNGVNPQSMLLCIISWCLITQSIIDIRVMMSSDFLHIITLASTFALSRLMGNSAKDIGLMMLVVVVLFIVLSQSMKIILKKDCLGFGDVKLFVALSVLFNLEQFTLFIGLTGIIGILFAVIKKFLAVRKSKNNNVEVAIEGSISQAFPYIPSIALAFFIVFYIYLFNL